MNISTLYLYFIYIYFSLVITAFSKVGLDPLPAH